MHRYNNQDHSMLAANCAVKSMVNGGTGEADIWHTNAEHEYHEEIVDPNESRTSTRRIT
jgi:hypothetical protein